MNEHLNIKWKEILLLLGSSIAICVVTNTYITTETTRRIEDNFRRENDIIQEQVRFLYNYLVETEIQEDEKASDTKASNTKASNTKASNTEASDTEADSTKTDDTAPIN